MASQAALQNLPSVTRQEQTGCAHLSVFVVAIVVILILSKKFYRK